jgi:hypothetical protein
VGAAACGVVYPAEVWAASPGSDFAPPVVLAGHCGGEPGIAADPSGFVYVTSPLYPVGSDHCTGNGTTDSQSDSAAYWVSRDGGRTFGPKSFAGTVQRGVAGGSDTHIVVDPRNGDVYLA